MEGTWGHTLQSPENRISIEAKLPVVSAGDAVAESENESSGTSTEVVIEQGVHGRDAHERRALQRNALEQGLVCDPSGEERVVQRVEPSDEVIVKRVVGGDVEAFRILVERYQPGCTRFARRRLGGDEADAEDVVQDTFLRAYRALPGYEDRGQFKAWLYRILVNQCRTAGGRRALRQQRHVPIGDDTVSLPGVEEDLLWKLTVSKAVAQLLPSRREAFLLKYVEDLTYEEISMASGDSISALKMRVKRACDDLKTLIEADRNG